MNVFHVCVIFVQKYCKVLKKIFAMSTFKMNEKNKFLNYYFMNKY